MKQFSIALASIGLLVAGLSGATSAIAASSCTAAQTSQTFSYTGLEQTLVVPAGVASINMYISGAQGGSGGGTTPGAGGLGGQVTGKRDVNAGDTLYIYVGGQGTVFNGAALGGNNGGGIGGGASDVRASGNAVANRIAVAGGGGGGGTTGCHEGNGAFGGGGAGGIGGGGAGTAGGDSITSGGNAGGGAGGTLGLGGAAGIGCGGFLGQVGLASGVGGNGQTCCCSSVPSVPGGGGGGGGDTVGGGGGGGSAGTNSCSGNSKGAGGGGSSMAAGLTVTTIVNGVQAGDGFIEMCLTKVADLAINKTDGSTTAVIGSTVTYTIVASNAGPAGVVSATVSDMQPAACTNYVWSCVGAGGASCTASGTGNINDTVSMPSGSTLTYLASCMVSASASGILTGTATITAPSNVTDSNLVKETLIKSTPTVIKTL